jgi:hypothetical protein
MCHRVADDGQPQWHRAIRRRSFPIAKIVNRVNVAHYSTAAVKTRQRALAASQGPFLSKDLQRMVKTRADGATSRCDADRVHELPCFYTGLRRFRFQRLFQLTRVPILNLRVRFG